MPIRPTVLTIDLENIRHNIREFKKAVSPAAVLAVVKADAYGHGAVPCARAALQAGAEMLAVALIEEGIVLRQAGIDAPILMLGQTDEQGVFAAVENDISLVLFTLEMLDWMEKAAQNFGKTVLAHLKLDTGMGRIGIRTEEELRVLLEKAQKCPHVRICGVMTHFATADVPQSEFGLDQIEQYEKMLAVVKEYGLPVLRHAAASAAAVRYPQARYDMVRAGLVMYGIDVMEKLEVRPVMSWSTRIVYLKKISAGQTVSYGRRFTANRETVIATIPVGYADGYRRAFSNRKCALVHGQRVQIAGTVCMDQVMLDVTDIENVQVGDEVVLLGCQGQEEINCNELAGYADTIPYEIMTDINWRVPRVFLHE